MERAELGPLVHQATQMPKEAAKTDHTLNLVMHFALPLFAGVVGGLLGGGSLGNRMIWALSVAGATEASTLVVRGCIVGAKKLNNLDESVGKTGNTIVFPKERPEEIYDPGVRELINTGSYYLAMEYLKIFGDSSDVFTDEGTKYYKEQFDLLVEKSSEFKRDDIGQFKRLKTQYAQLFPPYIR